MKRVILAFLIAPGILPALLIFGSRNGDVSMATELAVMLATSVYGVALVLGVPLFWVFRRRGWLSLCQFAAGGALLGLAPLLLDMLMSPTLALGYVLVRGTGGAMIGAVSACVFWCIGIWRNAFALVAGANSE